MLGGKIRSVQLMEAEEQVESKKKNQVIRDVVRLRYMTM